MKKFGSVLALSAVLMASAGSVQADCGDCYCESQSCSWFDPSYLVAAGALAAVITVVTTTGGRDHSSHGH